MFVHKKQARSRPDNYYDAHTRHLYDGKNVFCIALAYTKYVKIMELQNYLFATFRIYTICGNANCEKKSRICKICEFANLQIAKKLLGR